MTMLFTTPRTSRLVRAFTLSTVFTLTASNGLALGALQEKDELFAGAEKFAANAKNSTEVNLDKNMLAMAMGKGGDKGEFMRKMDFVIVRSYEYAKAGDYNMADVDQFSKRLDSGGWSHIVKERSAKENTDVCIRSDKEGQVSELVVISAEPLELTFVHLKGHLNMNDLMKAGGKFGVPQTGPAAPESEHPPKLQKH